MQALESMGKYSVVVIDPPWPTSGYLSSVDVAHKKHDYSTMPIPDIAAMPIENVMCDDSWLFMWTTNGMMPEAYKLLECWGCRYRFTMAWHKGVAPKPYGLPQYNAEYIIVGSRGNPKFRETTDFFLLNTWAAFRDAQGAHIASAKPSGFYRLLERVTEEPRLDIFGRRHIEGFDGWGNEYPDGTSKEILTGKQIPLLYDAPILNLTSAKGH